MQSHFRLIENHNSFTEYFIPHENSHFEVRFHENFTNSQKNTFALAFEQVRNLL